MGASLSTDSGGRVSSPEELSRILADRFATKCFTPLELTHLKDNFYSRALDQGGLKYWNEEILSRFLGIPDGAGARTATTHGREIDAGPVIFRMVSYLGAFPFQNTLAPSVLTFEALVKVVVLLTERYGRVLRRGRKDRMKLLFGSLADVGRRDLGEKETQKPQEQGQEQPTTETTETERGASHAAGFSIDAPANDEEEEEDDDDLALAALESLDAIEVFKHDYRVDRTVYEARISIDTFCRLLLLLLATASLGPRDEVTKLTTDLEQKTMDAIYEQVDCILGAVVAEDQTSGITYREFSRIIANSLPYIFDPLTPLFEHLLFSENLNLSRRRGTQSSAAPEEKPAPLPSPPSSPPSPTMLAGSFESNILNPAALSHLSFFLATSSAIPNMFRNHTKLHPIFSSTVHGESLTSFSHHVLTWQSPSLLLLNGTTTNSPSSKEEMVTVGAYLPQPWKSSSSSSPRRSSTSNDLSALPCLFQLSPTHTVLHGSPSFTSLKSNMPVTSFSTKTGIALGCLIPPSSRGSTGSEARPKPSGGGSLLVDSALENATFVVSDGLSGEGVFLPPGISPASTSSISPSSTTKKTTEISIYNIEVWGIMQSAPQSGASTTDPAVPQQDAIALQKSHWDFEKRDAERRKNINVKVGGGESEEQTGRALLEMAGIIEENRRR